MKGWGKEQRLWEWPANNYPNLRTIPWETPIPNIIKDTVMFACLSSRRLAASAKHFCP